MKDHTLRQINISFAIIGAISLAIGVCCLVMPQRTAVFFFKLLFSLLIGGGSSIIMTTILGVIGITNIGESIRLDGMFTKKKFGKFMIVLTVVFTAIVNIIISDWIIQGGLGDWIILKSMLFESIGTYRYVGRTFLGIMAILFFALIYLNFKNESK